MFSQTFSGKMTFLKIFYEENHFTSKETGLTVNQFADLNNEEFRAMRNSYRAMLTSSKASSFRYGNLTDIPPSVDWRQKGAVTPVKNQGNCGK
jgi:KDEL-tailed cysteine endopeptidase